MKSSEILSKLILNTTSITVTQDENALRLKIIYSQSLWEEILIGGLVVVFLYALNDQSDVLWGAFLSVVLIVGALALGFVSRRYESFFNVKTDKITIDYNSVMFANLNARSQKFKIKDVSQVGIRRHLSRGGDTFQIFIIVDDKSVNLTGKGVSFQDAQKCADIIRGFLNLNTPLKAEG